MRKKRKGCEILCPNKQQREIWDSTSTHDSMISNLKKTHFSLEECSRRLKKRCKEDDAVGLGSCSRTSIRLAAATAPAPGGSSSISLCTRGLKRKIGCIDAATQMGRKNKIEDDYVMGEALGKGKFGSVFMCRSKLTGVEFACKTLPKGEETVHREVEIMQHLSGHPGVVTLQSVYEDGESFHLVMELCSGGRLIDRMTKEGRFSEHKAANIFKDLMMVIQYCHDMGVVHRDIKPENILLTASGKIKLADFGLAMRIANGQSLSGLAGSPAYVAPEVLIGDYGKKTDIWSAGVLLHALLVGILPFQGGSLDALFEAIKSMTLDFHSDKWQSVSKPARDLLERILTRDVAARITAEEVLSHPWMLFYTERTLKPVSVRLKPKHFSGTPSQIPTATSRLESDGKKRCSKFNTGETKVLRCENLNRESGEFEESDDSGLVDVLAAAILHCRISEPKRSRLCVTSSPIREQCSSNLKSSLCKAF
ncbi:serine/threonine-protein kinase PEPKR2 [Nicotiana sylvestris]|uniref:Serine/threonine-protein kinase PEPKR2-like n=1 Tax=Nicotiana sylvestris TaxID=4096 RepID=A0A1U7Y6S4_NICSY|nr:PREDICTED: serine/threonine-protein kinase PEPKR2-like [Nicotiana sylvestris]XP_016450572.1 PREDICTED: serine/threonine-protein kinase PEPKR2-like [Nicotiana tabacum]